MIDSFEIPINYRRNDLLIIPELYRAKNITLGDLHGNTLTLFIVLVKSGIFSAPLTKDYILIREIIISASSGNLTTQEYETFLVLLNKLKVMKTACQGLRLLGDVLADRVSNDVLTLAIISKLVLVQFPITIIYSNHDNFVFICLSKSIYGKHESEGIEWLYSSHMKFKYFINQLLSENKQTMVLDIHQMLLHYISTIKMFDFILTQDKFVIYSHAYLNTYILQRCYLFIDPHKRPQLIAAMQNKSPAEQLRLFIAYINEDMREMLKAVWKTYIRDFSQIKLSRELLMAGPTQELKTISVPVCKLEPKVELLKYRFESLFQSTGLGYAVLWFRYDELRWTHLNTPFDWSVFGKNTVGIPAIPSIPIFNIHGHDKEAGENAITYDQNIGKSFYLLNKDEEVYLQVGIEI